MSTKRARYSEDAQGPLWLIINQTEGTASAQYYLAPASLATEEVKEWLRKYCNTYMINGLFSRLADDMSEEEKSVYKATLPKIIWPLWEGIQRLSTDDTDENHEHWGHEIIHVPTSMFTVVNAWGND